MPLPQNTRSSGFGRIGDLLSGGDGAGRVLLVSLVITGASNLLFQVVMSRLMAPVQFGALGSVLALLTVALVPATALQMAVTAAVARRTQVGYPGDLATRLRRVAAVVVALGLAIARPLGGYLHLDSVIPVILAALVLVPAASLIVSRGVLLGRQQYAPVAAATIAGNVVKLVAGVGLVAAGRGLEGALIGVLAGEIVTAAALRSPMLRIATDATRPFVVRRGEVVRAVTAYSGFWVLSSLGVVIARHYHPEASGDFTAAWVIAGAILFLPSAFVTVVFPRFAHGGANASRVLLARAAGVTLALAAVTAVVPMAFSGFTIAIVVGSEYAAAAAALVVLCAAAVLMSLVNAVVQFYVARDRAAANLAWLGVAVVAFGSLVYNQSLIAIAWLTVAGAGTALIILLLSVGSSEPWRLRKTGPALVFGVGADLDVTVVVPYLNPGPRIVGHLHEIDSALAATGLSYEVLPVSDGSTDGSDDIVAALASDSIRPIRLPYNTGKGSAVRVGLRRGRGRYLGFIDGDGDIDPAVLGEFAVILEAHRPDVVLGSKLHDLSRVEAAALRRVMSWGYQHLVRALFRLGVTDTQAGVKLVRREVLAEVMPYLLERRFTFDLELLVVARRFGYRAFFEVPITLRERMSSTIRIADVVGIFKDTCVVFLRLHGSRRYDPIREPLDLPTRATVPVDVAA